MNELKQWYKMFIIIIGKQIAAFSLNTFRWVNEREREREEYEIIMRMSCVLVIIIIKLIIKAKWVNLLAAELTN